MWKSEVQQKKTKMGSWMNRTCYTHQMWKESEIRRSFKIKRQQGKWFRIDWCPAYWSLMHLKCFAWVKPMKRMNDGFLTFVINMPLNLLMHMLACPILKFIWWNSSCATLHRGWVTVNMLNVNYYEKWCGDRLDKSDKLLWIFDNTQVTTLGQKCFHVYNPATGVTYHVFFLSGFPSVSCCVVNAELFQNVLLLGEYCVY